MTQEKPKNWAKIDPKTKKVVEITVATESWILSGKSGDPSSWIEYTNYRDDDMPGPCGIGITYDSELNQFIPDSPYPSWVLNRDKIEWEPPVQKPQEVFVVLGGPIGIQTTYKLYEWDEETTSWVVYRESMVPTGDTDPESEYYIAPTRTQEEAEADNG
jgi:hypothetical protein